MDTTIEYKISSSGEISPITPQSGGVLGDDNTVIISVDMSALNIAEDEYIRIDFSNGSGGFYSSEHLTLNEGKLTYLLPYEVTSAGGTAQAHIVIVGHSSSDGVQRVRYSFPIRIYFKDSTAGTAGYARYSQELSGLMLKAAESASKAEDSEHNADSAAKGADESALYAASCARKAAESESNAAESADKANICLTGASESAKYAASCASKAAESEANIGLAISTHNTDNNAHEDIREKIAADISAHNTDNNAHEGPFNSLRTFVIGVNSGLSSAKDKLNLLQKYPCYEYGVSGGAVQRFDDVSVIEHNIGVTVHGATDENGNSVTTPTVKVYGKNLFSLSEGESGNGFTFSGSNCKIENPTSYYYTLNSTDRIKLPKGTYTFTANVSGSIDYGSANILLFSYSVCGSTKTLIINKSEFESGTRIFTNTFTAEEAFEFYIERVSFDGRTPTSADLSIDLQLEVGDTMTDYEPYTEPQTATLPTTLPAGQNGEIANRFNAVSPTMTVIASDNNNLIDTVDVTYNKQYTVDEHNISPTAHDDIREKIDEIYTILSGSSGGTGNADEKIDEHNTSPEAHENIRADIDEVKSGLIDTQDNVNNNADMFIEALKMSGTYICGYGQTSIGDQEYLQNKDVKYAYIADGVTSIGDSAFKWCDSLTSVTIPDSVTTIGSNAFFSCKNLESVTIPNSVTSIGACAFHYFNSLTSITIPDSVTTIGESAFYYNQSLKNITIGNSVTTIGRNAFAKCGMTSVTIPSSVTSIGEGVFHACRSLTSIDVSSDNNSFCSQDGVLFNIDKTYLIQYPMAKTDSSYQIPDSVTFIHNAAFQDCVNLTSITIPSSVTHTFGWSFIGCSKLTVVNLGDDFNCGLDISAGTYTADVMVAMFNKLKDLTGVTAKTLTLGSTNLAKLTDEQKAIATNKNWNLA